ncbi:2-dehydro-3-deoxygalactonokinase [Georgenia sp. TF02-10]|uniref:2-dehydro-3-deoxygalactonokinase n=1 Tax=Georgenia sp. TF02-10 TaxID=2917725 RepID=UPI001FA79AF3|nr:2-dehydro-3-deoxygalactonokinase [Georgenia sp. TF02-10]UNX54848.1 2-dehydro-3-deoxygalactonokinase [Georgenia sp. TF02-10]
MTAATSADGALVAVDWGTSTFRAWLLDPRGRVLDTCRSSDGSRAVAETVAPDDVDGRATAFAAAFLARCGSWLAAAPGIPVLASGMVGSNHGWHEAGYLDLPADLGRLAEHLVSLDVGGSRVHIVPGLRATGATPDVIRGEEVQVLGALAGLTAGAAERRTVLLPGTHSKWVTLRGEVVTDFVTAMTGELFHLVLERSIIATLAAEAAPSGADRPAFARGLEAATGPVGRRGLAAALFTARTLVMAGRLRPAEVPDYISGLLVGDEVAHVLPGLPTAAGPVLVCGAPDLADRYVTALARHHRPAVVAPQDATVTGLWAVARAAGLVDRPVATATQE